MTTRAAQLGFASSILATCLGLAAPASAATADAAKLTISQTAVQLSIERGRFFQDRTDPGDATGTLIVSNQGTVDATGVTVEGFYADGSSVSLLAEPEGSVGVGDAIAIKITLQDWSYAHPDKGYLVLADSGGSPPVTVPFQVKELLPVSVFVSLVIWSGVLALLACFAAHVAIFAGAKPANARRPKFRHTIAPVAPWTFNGSWASTLTALGAILGTVLAASGFLTDVVPGLSSGMFLAMNLFFAFLALVAPVIYSALHDHEAKPTYGGLLAAGIFTLWAAIGQLAAAAQLITRSGLSSSAQYLPWVVVAVMVIVLAAYTRTSLALVLDSKAKVRLAAIGAARAKAVEMGISPPQEAVVEAAVDAAAESDDGRVSAML
jgi:hypothetical protein